MRKETKEFTIGYDKDIDYIDDLIKKLEQEEDRILNFFELKNLKEKKENKNMDKPRRVSNSFRRICP